MEHCRWSCHDQTRLTCAAANRSARHRARGGQAFSNRNPVPQNHQSPPRTEPHEIRIFTHPCRRLRFRRRVRTPPERDIPDCHKRDSEMGIQSFQPFRIPRHRNLTEHVGRPWMGACRGIASHREYAGGIFSQAPQTAMKPRGTPGTVPQRTQGVAASLTSPDRTLPGKTLS